MYSLRLLLLTCVLIPANTTVQSQNALKVAGSALISQLYHVSSTSILAIYVPSHHFSYICVILEFSPMKW